MRVVVCGLWWCVCGGAAVWRLKCSEPKVSAVLRASNSAVKHERAGVITGRFRGTAGGRLVIFCLVIFFWRGASIHKRNATSSLQTRVFFASTTKKKTGFVLLVSRTTRMPKSWVWYWSD